MSNSSKDISQLRDQLLGQIKNAADEGDGMISLLGHGITINWEHGASKLLVTDVSTFDDGDLRISGFVDGVYDPNHAFTLMGNDLNTINVEDLNTLLAALDD